MWEALWVCGMWYVVGSIVGMWYVVCGMWYVVGSIVGMWVYEFVGMRDIVGLWV